MITHTPPFNINSDTRSAGLCATGAMIALDIFVTCMEEGRDFLFIYS